MLTCPNCGSTNYYNHDTGWEYLTRLFSMNSRLVCRSCHTTWRRRTPEKFAKLKRRSRSGSSLKLNGYHTIPVNEALIKCSPDDINSIVGKWQEDGTLHICFDLSELTELNTMSLGNLMRIYRRLKSIGGDLILANGSKQIMDNLWSLNLGYLIATDQKILT